MKGMRRRYLSLIAAPGLTEAHLLIYESEAKWAASNPPNSSPSSTPSPSRTSPQLSSPASPQNYKQFLQADDGSREGAKYLISLEGLFYAGINHVNVSGRLSVTAFIKSAMGKLMIGSSKSQDSTLSGHHRNQKDVQLKDSKHQSQISGADSSKVAGSAESYISTTSSPGTLNSTEASRISSQRPASICGIPLFNGPPINPDSPNGGSNNCNTNNSARSPTSLGLYFQDGSSTLMSFASPDIMEAWLKVLTVVVATNRSRSGYPNIEYASTVTCRFKPKEFNSGPFPKIKGECLFCLSKLDVLLVTQNIKQPDLSIRFPYVRNCASRDDGRLCFDVGRAAPTGECELILQMPNAKEAKAAHTRCITLMRQCTTWLKLGRDGPSSRRKTLLNFGKKTTGVNLAGPPLPRVPGAEPSNPAVAPSPPMPEEPSPLNHTPISTSDNRKYLTAFAASNHLPILPESLLAPFPPPQGPPPPLIPLPDLTTLALSSHSASHLIGRRLHPHFSYSSLSRKSHSFPSRLSTEPIPEVVLEEMAASEQNDSPCHSSNKSTDVTSDAEDSPPTPTRKSTTDSTAVTPAPDPVSNYLQLNVDNLVGTHIKSIAKYTAGESLDGSGKGGKGGKDRLGNIQNEVPSEEAFHFVLAYLSSITRPSKAAGVGECETPRSGTVTSVSRQPTVKFSPNTLMIPADQGRDGVYVDSRIFGIDQLTTKVGSQSSDISRTSSTKKTSSSSGKVQLRRPKRGFSGYSSQGGNNLGISSGGSGGSMSSTNRSRIYSHRDNDELFADLNYGPAGSSRQTVLCQKSKGTVCDRSSISFEAGHMSMVEGSCCSDENDNGHKRPRTASDTGTKWKTSITGPIRFIPSTTQIADALSRPRARSLTHQLATKPLSQPIGIKDVESRPSGEVYNGVIQLGSRSSSTTSTSKNIRRPLEHDPGRPQSTEEGNGLFPNLISPSHHFSIYSNNNNNSTGDTCTKGNPNQDKSCLNDSDIYVELDFPPPNQCAQPVGNELTSEMPNALRGSLLVTPSDSLSSNSSRLSFYGGGGSINSGRQSLPTTSQNTNSGGGMSFTEHYGFVFGQGLPGMHTGRAPYLIKPAGVNTASVSPTTTACDMSSPTSAH